MADIDEVLRRNGLDDIHLQFCAPSYEMRRVLEALRVAMDNERNLDDGGHAAEARAVGDDARAILAEVLR